MKKSSPHSMAGLALTLLTAGTLLFSGCQGSGEPQATGTPKEVGTFTGQQLPDKVEKLQGTPFYSISPAITEVAKLKGACYLVIAPQDPTTAILVHEANASADEVSKRESKSSDFSGRRTFIESAELVSHVKQTYELDLHTGENGKIAVLELSSPPTTSASEETDVTDGE